jgi:hypothetical protein
MNLADTIRVHKANVQKVADSNKNVRIGSPAVTNGAGNGMGLNFLQSFLSGCNGCRIDFVAIHWYNGGSVEDFKKHVTNVHNQTKKNVWVTEFAAPDNSPDKAKFMKDVMAWMDGQSFVERYAYMSVDSSLTSGNSLTALGKAYA